MGCQKHFTKLQKLKNTKSEIKPIKIGKRPGATYCFGQKDYTHIFRPEIVKMTNKVLREKFQGFQNFEVFKTKTQKQKIIEQIK